MSNMMELGLMSYRHFLIFAVSGLLLQDYLTQNGADLLNGLQVTRNLGVTVKANKFKTKHILKVDSK